MLNRLEGALNLFKVSNKKKIPFLLHYIGPATFDVIVVTNAYLMIPTSKIMMLWLQNYKISMLQRHWKLRKIFVFNNDINRKTRAFYNIRQLYKN